MDKKTVMQKLKQLREETPKRNFKQSFDYIMNLKDINLKDPTQQVEFFLVVPNPVRAKKICAIVGGELEAEAKKVCDLVITQAELDKYKKDKKLAKKLASEYDYFIAQANLMGQIAGAVGRVFGPRGKMPNPKAGCVVPPKTNLQPLYDRLQKTIKVSAKKFPVIQLTAGKEDMSDEEVVRNIVYFEDQIIHHLPKEQHNVRGSLIKMTMGKPLKL